ncbi:MAG: hypothetical protein J6S67_09300, partial [Methanobrevibacter sp.]|nr:hypothetical protein [Methanobrevibacter sp.]
ETFYKENMVGSTGGSGGVTSGEVQSMIDESISGKADTSAVTEDISAAVSGKANNSAAYGSYAFGEINNQPYIRYKNVSGERIGNEIYYPKINGKGTLTNNATWAQNNLNFQLVETSAITSAVTSASTNSEIPSAKAVYDAIAEGGGGTTYSAGTGISISGDTITGVYDGYLSYDSPQYGVSNYNGELYIKAPWYDCSGQPTGQCRVYTAEYSDSYNYKFTFNQSTKQYTLDEYPAGKENDWQDYFTLGFDEKYGIFKLTTIQEIMSIEDAGCSRLFRIGDYGDYSIKYSGTTADAFNGVIDNFDNYIYNGSIGAYGNKINLYLGKKWTSSTYEIELVDLIGENNRIRTNIQVGTGVSGWTNNLIDSNTCEIVNLPSPIFKISGGTTNMEYWYFTIRVNLQGNWSNDAVYWSVDENKFVVSSSWFNNGEITINWDSNEGLLTVEYPTSSSIFGEDSPVTISSLSNNFCQFGSNIYSVQCYAEIQQPINEYVQQFRADVNEDEEVTAAALNALNEEISGKVETSAITSAITSASTYSEVASAKAVDDRLGGLSLVKLTQQEYDALSGNTDSNTLYVIV